jgi:hypothetical protein
VKLARGELSRAIQIVYGYRSMNARKFCAPQIVPLSGLREFAHRIDGRRAEVVHDPIEDVSEQEARHGAQHAVGALEALPGGIIVAAHAHLGGEARRAFSKGGAPNLQGYREVTRAWGRVGARDEAGRFVDEHAQLQALDEIIEREPLRPLRRLPAKAQGQAMQRQDGADGA